MSSFKHPSFQDLTNVLKTKSRSPECGRGFGKTVGAVAVAVAGAVEGPTVPILKIHLWFSIEHLS